MQNGAFIVSLDKWKQKTISKKRKWKKKPKKTEKSFRMKMLFKMIKTVRFAVAIHRPLAVEQLLNENFNLFYLWTMNV